MIGRHHQNGVALLMAVIIVALATIAAAAIAYNGAMTARRGANIYTIEQATQVARGAEAMAAYALREDRKSSVRDNLTESWAAPYGPVEMEAGVVMEAGLEDLHSRFNINDLVDSNGVSDPVAREIFDRLLGLLGMETRWSGLITDWLDADSQAVFPDGAEDGEYSGLNPPYRTANVPVTSISELLALPGFGRENYARLQPFVTALPPGSGINHCTASGMVLDALLGGKQEFSINDTLLQEKRKADCFPLAPELQAAMSAAQWLKIKDRVSESSRFFRLRSYITIGTTRFTLYSLLNRDQGGQIRVVLRSFGTE